MSVRSATETKSLVVPEAKTIPVQKSHEKKASCADRAATWILTKQQGSLVQRVCAFFIVTIAAILLTASVIGVPFLMCLTDSYLRKKGEMRAKEAEEKTTRHFQPQLEERDQRIAQITQTLTTTQEENTRLTETIRRAEKAGRKDKLDNLATIQRLNEKLDAQSTAVEKEKGKRERVESSYLELSLRRDEIDKREKDFNARLDELNAEISTAKASALKVKEDLEATVALLEQAMKERDSAIKDPSARTLIKERDAEINSLSEQLKAVKGVQESYEEKMESMGSEHASLKETLKKLESAMLDAEKQQSAAATEMASLKKRSESLAGQIVEMETALKEATSSKESVQSVQVEMEMAAKELSAKIASLNNEKQQVQQQLDSHKSALQASQEKVTSLTNELTTAKKSLGKEKELSTKVTSLANEKQQIQKDLEAHKSALQTSQEKVTSLTNELAAAKKPAEKVESKASKTDSKSNSASLYSSSDDFSSSSSDFVPLFSAQPVNNDQSEQISSLSSQLESANDASLKSRQEAERLATQLRATQDKSNAKDDQIRTLTSNLDAALAKQLELANSKKELDARLLKTIQDLETAKFELTKFKTAQSTSPVPSSESEELARLQRANKAIGSENLSILQRLDTANNTVKERDAEISRLKAAAQIPILPPLPPKPSADLEEQAQQRKTLESLRAELSSVNQQLSDARQSARDNEEALEIARSKHQDVSRQLHSKSDEVTNLQRKLSDMSNLKQQKEEELAKALESRRGSQIKFGETEQEKTLKAAITQKENLLTSANNKVTSLTDQIAKNKTELDALKRERDQLKRDLAGKDTSKLEADLAKAKQDVVQLTKEADANKIEFARLKSKELAESGALKDRDTMAAEKSKVDKALAKAQSEKEEVLAAHSKLSAFTAQKNAELNQKGEQIAKMQADLDARQSKIEDLTHAVQDTNSELERARAELADLKKPKTTQPSDSKDNKEPAKV